MVAALSLAFPLCFHFLFEAFVAIQVPFQHVFDRGRCFDFVKVYVFLKWNIVFVDRWKYRRRIQRRRPVRVRVASSETSCATHV